MRGIRGKDVWKGGTEVSGTCAWGQVGCEQGLHVMGCAGIPSAVCSGHSQGHKGYAGLGALV